MSNTQKNWRIAIVIPVFIGLAAATGCAQNAAPALPDASPQVSIDDANETAINDLGHTLLVFEQTGPPKSNRRLFK